ERLAALRIGLAAVLLLDILTTYLPCAGDLFGAENLGGASVDGAIWQPGRWLAAFGTGLPQQPLWQGLTIIWALAAGVLLVGFLLVGWLPRGSAAVAWALGVFLVHRNPHIHNGGDIVRNITLFYLMLSPCAAVWRWSPAKPDPRADNAPVYTSPWPLRLLFLQ